MPSAEKQTRPTAPSSSIAGSWEEVVIKHFDQNSSSYDEAYSDAGIASHFFKMRTNIVVSLLDKVPGGRLLDVGCGPGLMAVPSTHRGYHYIGIDISQGMISRCRQEFHHLQWARFVAGKMQDLPFADDLFDVVLCMGALEYVPAAEEIPARIEMVRVLKPGGLLIVSHLNRLSPYWLWDRFGYHNMRRLKAQVGSLVSRTPCGAEQVPLRQFGEAAARRLLATHGIEIVQTPYYGFNVVLPPFDRKFPALALSTSRRFEYLCNGALRRLAMAFIVVGKKS